MIRLSRWALLGFWFCLYVKYEFSSSHRESSCQLKGSVSDNAVCASAHQHQRDDGATLQTQSLSEFRGGRSAAVRAPRFTAVWTFLFCFRPASV